MTPNPFFKGLFVGLLLSLFLWGVVVLALAGVAL